MRNSPKRSAAKLVKYMGTREGVEKVSQGFDRSPVTVRQQRLIAFIMKQEKRLADYLEYQTYCGEPCKGSASEFIDAYMERNADRIGDSKAFVNYMAQRPGVEKLGSHGLFSQTDDAIDLDSVAEEVGQHPGIIWTHVISLRREDAERLGYNKADAWKKLIRRNALVLAENMKISPSNLQWYAAFHNTTHHPHVHLLVYSHDPKQGWLTKKSIDTLRSTFGNDIFRNEQYKLFTMETEQRNRLKELIQELLERISQSYECPAEIVPLFQKLQSQLTVCKGKKQYGYLPPAVKETVNAIIREMAKADGVAELYAEWNRVNREKLSLYYEKHEPDIPLEYNPAFHSLKNAVVRTTLLMTDLSMNEQPSAETINRSMNGIFKLFCQLASASYERKRTQLHSQADRKLLSKIQQKKIAHGIKIEPRYVDEEQSYRRSPCENRCRRGTAFAGKVLIHLRFSFWKTL